MTDILMAAAIGWLTPFAAFGLYALVHFCRPYRPAPKHASLADAFFVEAASDSLSGRHR